jgi:hypothetical protein
MIWALNDLLQTGPLLASKLCPAFLGLGVPRPKHGTSEPITSLFSTRSMELFFLFNNDLTRMTQAHGTSEARMTLFFDRGSMLIRPKQCGRSSVRPLCPPRARRAAALSFPIAGCVARPHSLRCSPVSQSPATLAPSSSIRSPLPSGTPLTSSWLLRHVCRGASSLP